MAELPSRRRRDDAKKGEDRREERRSIASPQPQQEGRPRPAPTAATGKTLPPKASKKRPAVVQPAAVPPPAAQPMQPSSSTAQPAKRRRIAAATAAAAAPAAASTAIASTAEEEISAKEAEDIERAIQQSLVPQQELPNLNWGLVPPNVEPHLFGDLLSSHRTTPFPQVDRGIPEDINEQWELLKCLFIKWFYVFSRLPHDASSAVEVWRVFLFTYHDQDLIARLRDLQLEGRIPLHRVPPFRVMDPPLRAGEVEEMRIRYEARFAASVHGLTYDGHREEYTRLAASVFNLYGCSHLYHGQK